MEELTQLHNSLLEHDWYYSSEYDNSGRIIIYANYINSNVYNIVPQTLNDKQVLVHFSLNKLISKQDFVDNYGLEPQKDELDLELQKLDDICGSNILLDLFYEIHDKDNAITNLSSKYPEIKQKLENLYEVYGFDVLYDKLDA